MLYHWVKLELPIKGVVLFESNSIELAALVGRQRRHEEVLVYLGQRKGLIVDSRIQLQVVI